MAASPTPYDGSSRPFTIGLKPIDSCEWIAPGDDLLEMLAEKDRLNREIPGLVFVEEPDTRQAQAELAALLADHLVAAQPEIYRRKGDVLTVAGGRHVDLASPGRAPLLCAADLVADDLVLMRKNASGWRLVAASLCFPSSWTLSEKFGRPLQQIHNPVPGFGEGTRTADVIQRIFDNLHAGQPVIRWNWSLQSDRTLYKPLSSIQRDERAVARPPRFAEGAASAFIRVERQTLRKLPVSGDIVFTIRINLDPMLTLAAHPDGPHLAAGLAAQLSGLDSAQLDYKGFNADRDRLVADLLRIAARQP
ncbi:MAG: DUF3445 domain-containing protein [Mesorhizobium sp.]|nr:DUF3445 domain-containing protein [Mesorhizobium sp.]